MTEKLFFADYRFAPANSFAAMQQSKAMAVSSQELLTAGNRARRCFI
jgi:hypothetical protein